jgi:N-hydroxyarylamine O-acetyltransferase
MVPSVDLNGYFERIRWGGDSSPSFETLAGILQAHMLQIPFENLDVLLKRPIRLDLEGLQAKLVRARRGGYCFEHVTLFAAVIEQLGFHPVRHSARVTLFRPRPESPRGHMFLTVPLAGQTFIVDPGFGAMAPRMPIPLAEGVQTRIGNDVHEMRREGHYWKLHAQNEDKTVDAWVSSMEQDFPVDFEMANYHTYSHPTSPFFNNVMLRALKPDGRASIMNRDLTLWAGDKSHASQLKDRAALRAVLVEHFGFDLPEVEHLRVPAIPEWI